MAEGWAAGEYLNRPLSELLADVGADEPAPAAGSVTAAVVALAAALTTKVARRSTADMPDADEFVERAAQLQRRVSPLITADAAGYAAVLTARRSGTGAEEAMAEAVRIPAVIAEAAAGVADLAGVLAEKGNPNLRADALAALQLAGTSAAVAEALVRTNTGGAEQEG